MRAVHSAVVLVVGDSRLAVAVLARALGGDAQVPAVATGEQALERLLLDPSIDALVCDLTLPGMSGLDLLIRLRRSPTMRLREMPFIALAGNDDPRRALEVISAGASAFVAKRDAARDLGPALAAQLPGRVALPRFVVPSFTDPDSSVDLAVSVPPSAPASDSSSESGAQSSIGPLGPTRDATSADAPVDMPVDLTAHVVAAGDAAADASIGALFNMKLPVSDLVPAPTAVVASVMRVRWETSPASPTLPSPPPAEVDQQIRYAFERTLRAADLWRPDGDGHGGVLGMACGIENSLRPMLRLAGNLRDAAQRRSRHVAIAIRLDAANPVRSIGIDQLDSAIAPDLPPAGEMMVALPTGRFRLDLAAVGLI